MDTTKKRITYKTTTQSTARIVLPPTFVQTNVAMIGRCLERRACSPLTTEKMMTATTKAQTRKPIALPRTSCTELTATTNI